jgi:hypothetical protein
VTSRKTRLLAAGLPLILLTGCALGRPQAFTARSNSFCSDALRGIDKLPAPATTLQQMQFATDRYTIVEKAVSELTDSRLPGGRVGDDLRARWLRPARADLSQGRVVLGQLRDALRAEDAAAATGAFDRARAVGTAGVDTTMLRTQGLDRCAVLFTAPSGR